MADDRTQDSAADRVDTGRAAAERVRTATFPVSRRGYDKREVDRFLARFADWLETGLGDVARSDTVREELARVGDRTKSLLTEAHQIATELQTEAQEKADAVLTEAQEKASELSESAKSAATKLKSEADQHAERTRIEADEYAKETRAEADSVAKRLRAEGQEAIERARAEAEEQARALTVEAGRRREELESMITRLQARRDTVVAELRRLSSELAGTATDHVAEEETRPMDQETPQDELEELEELEDDSEPIGTGSRFEVVADEEEEDARRLDELRNL